MDSYIWKKGFGLIRIISDLAELNLRRKRIWSILD